MSNPTQYNKFHPPISWSSHLYPDIYNKFYTAVHASSLNIFQVLMIQLCMCNMVNLKQISELYVQYQIIMISIHCWLTILTIKTGQKLLVNSAKTTSKFTENAMNNNISCLYMYWQCLQNLKKITWLYNHVHSSFQTSANIIHELVHRTLISMICAVKPLQTDTCWKWMLSIAGHLVKVPPTHKIVRTCMWLYIFNLP